MRYSFMDEKKLIDRCGNRRIEIAVFFELLSSQEDRCAICQREFVIGNVGALTFDGRGGSCIDHCHLTGIIRGVLCGTCNRALGIIEQVGLTAFANYLLNHQKIEPLPKIRKGFAQPQCVRDKISKSKKGMVFSAEHAAAISKGKKGKPGRVWTEEQKKKLSDRRKGARLVGKKWVFTDEE